MKLHNLLKRQLKKTIDDPGEYPEEVGELVDKVNQAYHDFDEDRHLLERSLEITSKEMVDRYKKIRGENEKLITIQQELQDKEKRLQSSLREKEALLVEVHHRVKNNLAAITGLLFLQMEMESNEQLATKLAEAQQRIQSMAMIHEMLYKSDSLSSIRIDKYLKLLVESLVDSYNTEEQQVNIEIQAKSLMLDIETAMPIALIVNELVTNSLKYAFPDGNKDDKITIKLLNGSNKKIRFIIADNGIGLADDVSLNNPDTVGFLLIQTFLNQLDGTVDVDTSEGTSFTFTIPFSALLKKRKSDALDLLSRAG
ncbi:sensor histidine kinase [Fodinibius halophilus]|uniref:histidine kinase n=1 Tax=Fodinibius halophilus TaxID=1736908 RepID=A0A6M1T996_9BACT|nr:sensor histidine kinase [Fodinibius halophilus]NGP87604.1 sensor histidine kinase [Fodinibius halophilus]